MDPRIGHALLLLGVVTMVAIRAPHDRRRTAAGFRAPHVTPLEAAVLTLLTLGLIVLPLIAVFSPWLRFADTRFTPARALAGGACLGWGLWLFQRAHVHLGRNWSPLLQLRAEHELIESGAYRRIRHPMYASLFVYGLGQALLLSNWVAGPSFLIASAALFAARVRAEERLMLERFGQRYRDYAARTKRLIPFVW